jgi:hypothetical protein
MRTKEIDGLLGFNIVYGVGASRIFSGAIMNAREMGLSPRFLFSCAEMIKNTSAEAEYNRFRSVLGVEYCENHQVWDSGGYSIAQSSIHSLDLTPEVISAYYQRYPCLLGIGVDAPFYNLPYESLKKRNRIRNERFHVSFVKPTNMLYYLPIHGHFHSLGRYTLKYKQNWWRCLKNDLCNGWAMRLLNDDGLLPNAYFGLLPWSLGVENFHVLGTANLKLLTLLVYLSKLYKRLSTDATNFTIQTIAHPTFWSFKDGRPSTLAFRGKTDDEIVSGVGGCRDLSGNSCEICFFSGSKFGKDFDEIFRADSAARQKKAAGEKASRSHQLSEWLVTHNIAVIEHFIGQLKDVANDRSQYLAFLQTIGMKGVVESIEKLIDPLIEAGTDAYSDRLTLLEQLMRG